MPTATSLFLSSSNNVGISQSRSGTVLDGFHSWDASRCICSLVFSLTAWQQKQEAHKHVQSEAVSCLKDTTLATNFASIQEDPRPFHLGLNRHSCQSRTLQDPNSCKVRTGIPTCRPMTVAHVTLMLREANSWRKQISTQQPMPYGPEAC